MAQNKKTAGKKASANKSGGTGREVILWVGLAISVILVVSNFGFGGRFGNAVSGFLFGAFGLMAYAFPFILIIAIVYGLTHKGKGIKPGKVIGVVVILFMVNTLFQLFARAETAGLDLKACYQYSSEQRRGGGIVGGAFANLFTGLFGVVIAYIVTILIILICLVLITEKSMVRFLNAKTQKPVKTKKQLKEEETAAKKAREAELARRKERKDLRTEQQSLRRTQQAVRVQKKRTVQEEKLADLEERRDAATRRRAAVRSTHIGDTTLIRPELNDIRYSGNMPMQDKNRPMSFYDMTDLRSEAAGYPKETSEKSFAADTFDKPAEDDFFEPLFAEHTENVEPEQLDLFTYKDPAFSYAQEPEEDETGYSEEEPAAQTREATGKRKKTRETALETERSKEEVEREIEDAKKQILSEYKRPPLNYLTKPTAGAAVNRRELEQTANKLQQTLASFGVNTHITDYACGPSVTRYELQPEQGVKVSRILNLADDIKLSLATPDIRIEAPIPGKSAVGIEVPNEKNSMVTLRELLESREFQDAESKISFAVGRDIGGKVVIADIFKMPHLLIGGATGSGKSVCINTLIMSILYKASPDEVKFIMIDPKMIELNLYNGIPHLLIPVVTDPKKAAGALQWAVAEMTKRYQYFSALGVRDLKSYNAKIVDYVSENEDEHYEKMPQIVIVVDEFADLMMVASGEVEEAVCRLAQLARAAGIHLILATQRPSVDVITGLIKANMPSRIALAVSSGVDSRTIIDMIGAEKLLGHGDMLYYPQGLSKPIRVQGAYVSEKEVEKVVEFVKQRNGDAVYDENVASRVEAGASSGRTGNGGGMSADDNGDGRDIYFAEAGRFIIEKEKASIGMLQRMYKIGFNRAARIMDQLNEAGVVGGEEGTKPRRILMTMEEFENYLEGNSNSGGED